MRKLRKEERKKVMTFTPVYDFQENFPLGYLADLTPMGALLVSEEPVAAGRAIILAIDFRETSEIPSNRRMILPVRVAWCQLEEHHTYYNAGLEFLKMTEPNKEVIETMLKKYQFSRMMPI